MDSNEHSKVIAFDTLFCTNHIQMLKVILPYMDNQTQKSMAIYIKFLELNYTISYFKNIPILSAAVLSGKIRQISLKCVQSYFLSVLKMKRNKSNSSAVFSRVWRCIRKCHRPWI